MYPLETNPVYQAVKQKLVFVKFESADSVATAQHLCNTVFIDRALVCVPIPDGWCSQVGQQDSAFGGKKFPAELEVVASALSLLIMLFWICKNLRRDKI